MVPIGKRLKPLNLGRGETGTISLQLEILEEILEKLPLKTLGQFKSVSKQWKYIIESQYFVEKHLICQKSRELIKILIIPGSDMDSRGFAPSTKNLTIESISIEESGETRHSYNLLNDFDVDVLRVSNSCNGLVCIYGDRGSVYVLNPTTKELRQLPEKTTIDHSNTLAVSSVGICRDVITGTYKVIRMFNCCECEVFALNTDAWRFIGSVTYPYKINPRKKPVYVSGSLYWFDSKFWYLESETKLIAFDAHTEKCRPIDLPDPPLKWCHIVKMFSLGNRLCLTRHVGKGINVWSMNPGGDWEKTYFIDTLKHIGSWQKYLGLRTSNIEVEPLMVLKEKNMMVIRNAEELVTYYFGNRRQKFRLVYKRSNTVMVSYVESFVSPFN